MYQVEFFLDIRKIPSVCSGSVWAESMSPADVDVDILLSAISNK